MASASALWSDCSRPRENMGIQGLFIRHSPDDSRIGLNIRAFPAFPQDKSGAEPRAGRPLVRTIEPVVFSKHHQSVCFLPRRIVRISASENRPGAASNLAAETVVRATSDWRCRNKRGRQLRRPLEIEVAHRSGAVKALDPSTGEQFSGTYVGIMPTVSRTSSGVISSQGFNASGFGIDTVSSNIANANAFLKGDKGTMLTCVMKIEGAVVSSPHGIGGCNDNLGKKYRLQF